MLKGVSSYGSPIPQGNGGTGSNLGNGLYTNITNTTPRSLLGAISAIASPAFIVSPREAFSDSTRSTAILDAGAVAATRDISGNGLNAAQATSANQPVYRITGINNTFPAFDFTQTTNSSVSVTSALGAAAFANGYTVYAVATSTGSDTIKNAIDVLFSFSNGDYLAIQNSGGVKIQVNGGASGPNFQTGDQEDYSGVYVMGYDGVNATVGLNGRYLTQAVAGTLPISTANFFVGCYKGNSGFNWSSGLIGDVWVFPGKHTQTQMDQIGAILNADVEVLNPSFYFDGDSMTVGFQLTTPTTQNWAYQLCLQLGAINGQLSNEWSPFQQAAFYKNVAISGINLPTMLSNMQAAPYSHAGYASPVRSRQNIIFLAGGATNDMTMVSSGGLGVSGTQAWTNMQALVAAYRSACPNALIIGYTVPSRNPANAGAGFETQRQIYNAFVYASGTSVFNAIIDLAASSIFGPANAYQNTTYYQVDGVHPNENGAAAWAQIATQTLLSIYDTSPFLPSITSNALPRVWAKILTGTTAGKFTWSMPAQGSNYKKFIGYFSGYENNSAVNQTVTFPTAFLHVPVITTNDSGLVITATATTLTITAPNNTTLFTGNIIVEGF